MSSSSAAEARITRFRLASGAVHVCINCIGPPGSVVVSSSSTSPAECTGSPYVHWDRNVVHTAGRVRGVEAVRVIERPVRVTLEVPLEVCKRSSVKAARLKLWARDVSRVGALLLQYVV